MGFYISNGIFPVEIKKTEIAIFLTSVKNYRHSFEKNCRVKRITIVICLGLIRYKNRGIDNH